MKPLLIFTISALVLPLMANAQESHFKSNAKEHRLDTTFSILNKHGLTIDRKNNPLFDLEKKHLLLENKVTKRINDPRDLVFPGASIYYARGSNLSPFTYFKSFVFKPDTTAKYYLIIKDPFDTLIKK